MDGIFYEVPSAENAELIDCETCDGRGKTKAEPSVMLKVKSSFNCKIAHNAEDLANFGIIKAAIKRIYWKLDLAHF